MKSTCRILALVLCLVMCLALFPASASAAAIMAAGNAGPNSEFVLYTDGKLVISGQGAVNPVNQWSFSSWGGFNSANEARVQTRSEIKNLVIQEGITRINAGAFQECAKLVSIDLPSSLTDGGGNAIGASAFEDCASLTYVYIPNNVQTIGSRAFFGCASLSEVYLSDGLQTIDFQAFQDCTALKAITIPANVQNINMQAFANCNSLKEITFTGNFPVINNTAFQNVKANVYYPVDNDSWNNGLNPLINMGAADFGGRLTWRASATYTESDGWVRKNGVWYYYMNGVMVRDNWVAYQGYWFYFGENGQMYTGRRQVGDKYYYFDPVTGARQSGWRNNEFYDENGVWQPAYSGVDDTGLNYFQNGWQQVNGNWYYIRNKAKVTGWIKDGAGYWYYLDPTSGAMVTGWLTWNGNTYYLRTQDMATADGIPDRVGSMIAGRTERIGDAATGKYYTFGVDGALIGGRADNNPLGNIVDTGWRRDLDANGNPNPNGGWYFYRSDGTRVSGGWEMISNGIQNNVGNNWYYFNSNGTMKTGWLNWNGGWYYLTPANGTGDPRTSTTGQMVTGFQNIGTTPQGVVLATPKTYFFKSNGALNGKGWIQVGKKWYYLRDDGSVATGWIKDGSNWFYLDDGTSVKASGVAYSFGEMVTGSFTVPATLADGTPNSQPGLHSFKANGVWIGAGDQLHKSTAGSWANNNGWHYYDADGVALTGWQYIDGKWYYLDPTSTPAGTMKTGFFQDTTATWYYADGNGVMQKGWQQVDGTWYLFDGNGARVTGWYQAGNGKWYYLNPVNGGMVNNITMEIDGEYWKFNSDGVCTGKVA